ncbi:MAG TPA: RCC1 domain-containing protein [Spirochaetia bacterium]|nr:RCC1 domain-containing protein [Spirochaetia bacterium]
MSTLWTFGRNSYGELGDGTTTDGHSPDQLGVEIGVNLRKCEEGSFHRLVAVQNCRD